jgi:hypothetical protein
VLCRCVEEGFRFRTITDGLHGFRVRAEALDILLIWDVSEALAARYRMADVEDSGPAAHHGFPARCADIGSSRSRNRCRDDPRPVGPLSVPGPHADVAAD